MIIIKFVFNIKIKKNHQLTIKRRKKLKNDINKCHAKILINDIKKFINCTRLIDRFLHNLFHFFSFKFLLHFDD